MDMEDRIKRYLDKVVDFLVEDTKVDYEHRMIFFPFTYKRSLRQGTNNLTPFHKLLFDSYIPIDGFMEYIKELYDITSIEDITHVWETYKVIMYKIVFGDNSSPLYFNESVDSKKIYLDKIVQYIIDDTVIDYDEGEIKYPYYSNILLINSDGRLPFSVHSFRPFSRYCNDMYGLGIEEIQYVWKEYRNKLIGGEYINESMDKISKGEYLDKIVDFLVDDTMVDQKNKVWYPPFPTDHAKPTFNHFYGLIPMTDHLELKFLIGNSYVGNFFNYCKDTYGLTDDVEISKVWKRYLKVLTPKINGFSIINGIPTINESVDRRDEYLNKIVDFLVDDTEMVYDIKVIRYPHLPNHPQFFSFSRFFLFNSRPSFSKYIKDNYSLNDEEIDYVWEEYKNIINEKTKP